ncbi:SAM-dependent methyltransferase [Shewanella sp. 202IG2-18]|uniref:SAM-dependent methyltransferase n=1 Tax=Parashewanella hymeniacidonis TaxID=2807618 RepID=UPI001961746E|nr:SAM-dependent methyltransferase [Parashewanella hymeniacidonis]MBM7070586.1 SAM-dependent methyltransferase [Parashewanella hymeniacidonis]
MPFVLEHVLIWSRSFDEYQRMFSLKKEDLSKKILGCADGASSFNVTAKSQGLDVTSCDPLYRLQPDAIGEKVSTSCELIYPKILNSVNDFNWDYFSSPQKLKTQRLSASKTFLNDYSTQRNSGKYINASLPKLPFDDNSFDIALCGNFLFLYSEILSADFHINSILELVRVAKEVRIFPLIGNDRQTPKQLKLVLKALDELPVNYNIVEVDYHFTKGANQMLKIKEIESHSDV